MSRSPKYHGTEYTRTRYVLDVWASWKRSKELRTDPPTMDAIFAETEIYVQPWRHARTGKIVLDSERPAGNAWIAMDKIRMSLRNSTSVIDNPVTIIGLATDLTIRDQLGPEAYELACQRLLWVYPRSGVYEAGPSKVLDIPTERKCFTSIHHQVLCALRHAGVTVNRLV